MKSKTVFKGLVISNIIVLCIALLVAIVCFGGYMKSSRLQSAEYNTVILNKIQETFDEKMKVFDHITTTISYDTGISSLNLIKNTTLTPHQLSELTLVMDQLEQYQLSFDFIDNILLYCTGSERVVTKEGVYDSIHEYSDLQSAPSVTEDLLEYKGEDFYLQDGKFVYITNTYFDEDITLMFFADASFIYDMFEGIREPEDLLVSVVNKLNQENIFYFGNNMLLPYIGEQGIFSFNDKNYVSNTRNSDINPWTYTFIVTESAFIQQTIDLSTLFITGFILLIGVGVCFTLAQRNSKPIKQMVDYISNNLEEEMKLDSTQYDEFSLIMAASRYSIDKYHDMQNTMEKYSELLKDKLVDQLLKGSLTITQLQKDSDFKNTLSFPYEQYYILMISLQSSNDIREQSKHEMILHLIDFVQNFYKTSSLGYAYGTQISKDKASFIVNVKQFRKPSIELMMNVVCKFADEHLSSQATSAVSHYAFNDDSIVKAFWQCDHALEQQILQCSGITVFTDQLQEESDVFYYPMEIENNLIDSVKAGSHKKVNQIIDNIIIENFVNTNLSIEASRCLFFSMMGTTIRIINTLGYKMTDFFDNETDVYKQITSQTDIQKLEVLMRETLSSLCDYIQLQKTKQTLPIVDVTDYIEQNYSDASLSLQSVAEFFRINPNYLSGYFKEHSGINFLVFLNSVRLKNACRLLETTTYTIDDVSKEVGYSSSAVFIRNFKRYKQDTPGHYREQVRLSANRNSTKTI